MASFWPSKVIASTLVLLVGVLVFAGEERPSDDFPIARRQYQDRSGLFYLHSKYGFIAKWDGGGNATFFLYDKVRTNITATTDFKSFLGGLSRFPVGSEVAWVNTCAAPLHYGMPAEMLSEIEGVLKQRRFKMAGIEENNFILCTCEATNLVLFTKFEH